MSNNNATTNAGNSDPIFISGSGLPGSSQPASAANERATKSSSGVSAQDMANSNSHKSETRALKAVSISQLPALNKMQVASDIRHCMASNQRKIDNLPEKPPAPRSPDVNRGYAALKHPAPKRGHPAQSDRDRLLGVDPALGDLSGKMTAFAVQEFEAPAAVASRERRTELARREAAEHERREAGKKEDWRTRSAKGAEPSEDTSVKESEPDEFDESTESMRMTVSPTITGGSRGPVSLYESFSKKKSPSSNSDTTA